MLDIENTAATGDGGLIPAPVAVCETMIPWLVDCQSGWQFGEMGVLDAIIDRIGPGRRVFVEFGAGDGAGLPLTCDRLVKDGWIGLLLEGDVEKAKALASRYYTETRGGQLCVSPSMVTIDGDTSLLSLLKNWGNTTPDVLVIDVDSIDYYIWRASASIRARIVCIEHYDSLGRAVDGKNRVPSPEECGVEEKDGRFCVQAGEEAVRELGESMGYKLVWKSRVNSIFVADAEYEKLLRVPVRINIGAGTTKIPGFTPLDIKTGTDMRHLPYVDGSVDHVYCSHALEHVAFDEVHAALTEMVRVLRPHGELWIAVPDFDKVKKDWNVVNRNFIARVVMGGQTDADDFHKSLFDEDMLRRAMNAVGVGMVSRFEPIVNDATCTPQSLNLKGRKRHRSPIQNPNITLILSQPRLGFTDTSNRLIALAHRMKFNVQPSVGAFWDRDMEAATWNAIHRDDPDFLLYADYDGIFDPDDVVKLIDTMNSDPTVACVGAVQMSRHDDNPLVFDVKKDYSGQRTDVDFHHFGLTLIDAAVFKEMQTPWFWTTPGVRKDGTVGFTDVDIGGCDADITFWRIMREYGFRVQQRNDVVVGHLVLTVKWPSNVGYGVTLQPIEMYQKYGKPPTATLNPDIYKKRMAEQLEKRKEVAK